MSIRLEAQVSNLASQEELLAQTRERIKDYFFQRAQPVLAGSKRKITLAIFPAQGPIPLEIRELIPSGCDAFELVKEGVSLFLRDFGVDHLDVDKAAREARRRMQGEGLSRYHSGFAIAELQTNINNVLIARSEYYKYRDNVWPDSVGWIIVNTAVPTFRERVRKSIAGIFR